MKRLPLYESGFSLPPWLLVTLVLVTVVVAVGCERGESHVPVTALGYDPTAVLTGSTGTASGTSSTSPYLFALAGSVLDKQTRQPIGNLALTLLNNGTVLENTRSTSGGTFLFGQRAAGLYDIAAGGAASGYDPATFVIRILSDGTTSPANPEILLIRSVSATSTGRLVTVFGTITDRESGDPVVNELVEILNASGTVVGRNLTDPTGYFSIQSIGIGDFTLQVAKSSLTYTGKSITLTVSADGLFSPTLALTLDKKSGTIQTQTISGIVRHATSREPMAAVLVKLLANSATGNELGSTYTSGEGRYFFESQQPGIYFLRFNHTDPQKFEPATTVVTILNDGTISPTSADVSLIPKTPQERAFTISGTVLDGYSGGPLDYVSCTLKENSSILSDYRGGFLFESVLAGLYQVEFAKSGFNSLSVSLRVDPDGTTFPATLTYRLVHNQEGDKGSIVGRIVDETTQIGLENLIVRVYPVTLVHKDPDLWSVTAAAIKSTRTATDNPVNPTYDERGAFKITHLQPTDAENKYLVYVGLATSEVQISTQTYTRILQVTPLVVDPIDYKVENTSNTSRISSWNLVEVAANTSTYLTNYERP